MAKRVFEGIAGVLAEIFFAGAMIGVGFLISLLGGVTLK